MPKKGSPYEILTQQIFQDILSQSAVKTISVQHDITINGKTTKHQIDVYWKFDLNGIIYETIVQAKDWASPVDQGKLLTFKGVLDDIPGQPRGIFVTRTGYQKGARIYAEQHGIDIYELRSPTDADFAGRIRTLHLHIVAHTPSSSGFTPIFDDKWITAERKRLAIPEGQRIAVSITGLENEIYVYDEARSPVAALWHEIQELFPKGRKPFPKTRRSVVFAEPRYVKTNLARFPWIKLNGFTVDVEINELAQDIILKAEDIVGFILRKVVDGSVRTFDKTGKELREEGHR